MPVRIRKGIPLPIVGLDVSKPSEYLDSRAASACQNIEINRSVLRKRLGTTAVGATLGERIMGLSQLKIGSTVNVVRAGLTKVQKLAQLTSTWSDIHNAVLTGTNMDRFDFAFPLLSGSKIMVFTNGIDNIRKWTGTGNDADLGGTPPKCKYLIDFGGYLVLGYVIDGGNDYSQRVQWSDTGDPETWTGGNSGSQELTEDGDDITGLARFGDFVTVHKENAIYLGYLVTTSEIFRFDRKNTGIGAVSHDTIKTLPTGDQIFLALDGIHLFNGITAPLVDSPIMDEIREQMSPTYAFRSWGLVVRELDEYWVGVPLGSQVDPETVYKYNYRTGQVYKDIREDITAVTIYERTNETTWDELIGTWASQTTRWNDVTYLALNPTPMFGDNTGITTRRDATNNDNGTAIDSQWESKDFTAADISEDDMGRLVRWTKLQIWAKGNGVDIEYSTDSGTTYTAITTLTLTSDYPADGSPAFAYLDVISTKIKFRFSNNTAGESFTLKRFIIEATPREIIK